MPVPIADDVRMELEGFGIDATQLSDSWITNTITNAILPWISRVTKMSFTGIQTVTEFYSGTGNSNLILNRRPVIDVIDMVLVTYSDMDAHLGIGNIEVIQTEGILKSVGVFENYPYISIFPKGMNNLKVTYRYGYADYPTDVKQAIIYFTCERVLGQVGMRTGGGDLNVQNYSRSFGDRGKWTHVRQDYARMGHALLRPYLDGIVAI